MTVAGLVTQIALSIVLTAWVLRRDMRGLTVAESARCWNEASFWVAVVVFGPVCLPVHFLKSRRSARGALVGVAWMVGVLVTVNITTAGVDALVSRAGTGR